MFDQISMFDDSPPAPPPPPPPPRIGAPRPDAPSGQLHSLFAAVVCSADGSADLHAQGALVDRLLGVDGRPLEASRLHVSLHAFGDYVDVRPDADIARWCHAAAGVRCAPFDVVFDRAATFGGNGHPLVLKASDDAHVAGLLALHQALGIALANAGERIKLQRITPHMTLSYRGRRIPETPIEPVRWRAHELVLIDSHVGAHRHDVVGRWPLQRP